MGKTASSKIPPLLQILKILSVGVEFVRVQTVKTSEFCVATELSHIVL